MSDSFDLVVFDSVKPRGYITSSADNKHSKSIKWLYKIQLRSSDKSLINEFTSKPTEYNCNVTEVLRTDAAETENEDNNDYSFDYSVTGIVKRTAPTEHKEIVDEITKKLDEFLNKKTD